MVQAWNLLRTQDKVSSLGEPQNKPKEASRWGLSQVSAHFYPERYTWPQAAAWKSVLSLWKHQPGSTSVHPWAECLGRTQEQENTCWKETF